MFADFF